MPTDNAFIKQVASQMMKGGVPGRLKITKKQRNNFERQHEFHILWAVRNLPRTSAAVPAVVVKCLIKYDYVLVASFCKALKNGLFKGQDDPAHVLWRFLQRHKGWDTSTVYKKTVAAAKAYMEGKTLTTLRPWKTDIFVWDEGFTVPDDLLAHWNPSTVPQEDTTPNTLEAISS